MINGSRLFPGNSQYNRFMRIFNAAIADDEEKFYNLGVQLGYLGSHSSWIFSTTMVASGYIVSPPNGNIFPKVFLLHGPC